MQCNGFNISDNASTQFNKMLPWKCQVSEIESMSVLFIIMAIKLARLFLVPGDTGVFKL